MLWRQPTDIASRDLLNGAGGQAHAPKSTTFTFIKEDLDGTATKFVVKDDDGVKWKVKLGAEAKPETAATRFLWAAGYFADEDYFLPTLRITELPTHLHRGQKLVGPGGTVHNARLKRELPDGAKGGVWPWKHAPFLGTREYNGLRVLMAVINNWDLKDVNNGIYQNADKERVYAVHDVGASFGTTGVVLNLNKARGNLRAYDHSHFITKITSKKSTLRLRDAPRSGWSSIRPAISCGLACDPSGTMFRVRMRNGWAIFLAALARSRSATHSAARVIRPKRSKDSRGLWKAASLRYELCKASSGID